MRPCAFICLAATLVAGDAARAASPPTPPAQYHAPRNAAGQPDLQGVWTNVASTWLERDPGLPLTFATRAEEAAYEARVREELEHPTDVFDQKASEWNPTHAIARIDGRLRTSWIVEPADGRLPWSAEGKRRYDAIANQVRRSVGDGPEDRPPVDRCLIGGAGSGSPPYLNPASAAGGKQIVQTPREVAILSEMNHDVRIVRLGARHLPAALHPWMGDAIGHWEGETLVVETTGFHPQEAFRNDFLISTGARVNERFRRVSPTELRYDFEVDDPVNYTRPWRAEMVFRAEPGPLYEYACHEGNYGLPNILAAARHQEAVEAKANGSRPEDR